MKKTTKSKKERFSPPPDDESADEQTHPKIRYNSELLKISEIIIRHKRMSSFEKFIGFFGKVNRANLQRYFDGIHAGFISLIDEQIEYFPTALQAEGLDILYKKFPISYSNFLRAGGNLISHSRGILPGIRKKKSSLKNGKEIGDSIPKDASAVFKNFESRALREGLKDLVSRYGPESEIFFRIKEKALYEKVDTEYRKVSHIQPIKEEKINEQFDLYYWPYDPKQFLILEKSLYGAHLLNDLSSLKIAFSKRVFEKFKKVNWLGGQDTLVYLIYRLDQNPKRLRGQSISKFITERFTRKGQDLTLKKIQSTITYTVERHVNNKDTTKTLVEHLQTVEDALKSIGL